MKPSDVIRRLADKHYDLLNNCEANPNTMKALPSADFLVLAIMEYLDEQQAEKEKKN